MAKQDSTTESWLRRDMESILHRLVQRPEFAQEIRRLALKPWRVPHDVARDPIVLAGARRAYALLEKGRRALAAHRAQEPELQPEDQVVTPVQDRMVRVAAGLAIAWIVVLLLLGSWLPAVVGWVGTGVVACVVWVLMRLGLTPSVRSWLRWALDHLRLMAGFPAKWWDQRQHLKVDVLVPELREWLHRQTTPMLAVELKLRDASGLTLPSGYGPLVRTAAVKACAREVNRSMPGAVGLAGARGAGKSTIIERAVRNEFTAHSRGPMLGVLTSAPVRYDARDFVLHIHSQVCQKVLDLLAGPRESRGSESRREWDRLHRVHRFRAALADVARGFVRAALLLGSAVGTAAVTWQRPWHQLADVGAAWQTVVQFALDVRARPAEQLRQLSWQHAVAVLCSVLVTAALVTLLRRLVWPVCAGTVVMLWRLIRSRIGRVRPHPDHTALRKIAEQHLRRNRFLQTHTEGWSGKVSGPRGTDLGVSRSLARTEQPWTHPEVVQRLRDFLELVVEVLEVEPIGLSGIVVGIDELDKIADPDDAHRFLNEIKGIFGVEHCLFLVSVSDDALTAFERRGMPARDAFDSAFTSMIHVRPFTLEQSRTWLAQRALGIPEPFVWLCHCLSGGLPRDLGRVAIVLHDLNTEHTRLGAMTRALVFHDLALKVRAFVHTARRSSRTEEDDPGQPHSLISDLQEVATIEHYELEELALHIWPESAGPPRTEVENLRAEAACYLLFCLTLIEVLHDECDPTALLEPVVSTSTRPDEEEVNGVVMLARIRQHMSVDIPLARDTLAGFRARLHPRA
ncbi:hypothetical protein BBK82_23325 [Lentzea guizhouensis]|uniref:KAP NTPase domain-containing protein n=1 Tax=Lentzea guizhouensis TaxID=1586287 RepID=A0A1B2HLG6_9PSEU|nr:hypothetical protein [Lentzea guizhouensis]ANZ38555.1 hypothetical protein BBK82_23325 [Lentzea guizhouensis]